MLNPIDSPDVKRLTALANAAGERRDWESSLALWNECLSRFPDDPNRNRWVESKANALTELRRFAEAASCYAYLIEKVPDYPLGHEGMARVANLRGNFLEAAENFEQCLAKFADHESRQGWLLSRGYALIEAGLYCEAEESFRIAAEKSPAEAYIDAAFATVAERRWDWRTAVRHWDKIIDAGRHDGDESDARIRKAWCQLETGEIEQAKSFFESILDRAEGFKGLAHIASMQDNAHIEGQHWDNCIATFPDEIDGFMGKAFLLFGRDAFREADSLLCHIISTFPDSIAACVLYARSATAAKDWKEAERRWNALLAAHARHPEVYPAYSFYLAAMGNAPRAEEYFSEFDDQPAAKNQCLLEYYLASDDLGPAIQYARELAELENEKPLHKLRLADILMREGSDSALYAAFRILKELYQKSPESILVKTHFAEACIRSKLDEPASALIETIPDADRRIEADMVRAWRAHRDGDDAAAKEYWNSIVERSYIPAIHAPIEEFRRIDSGRTKIQPGELLLFSAMRNELPRLPWFLDYYRRLGIEKFVIVDNMSTDGGVEFLLNNDDVVLYQTPDRYSFAGAGMRWINDLVDRHGRDNWCLHVDADEAFVFPGSEHLGLRQLTRYLDSKGYEAVLGPLLDVFPSSLAAEDSQSIEAQQAAYVYLDKDIRSQPFPVCPYVEITGGVRWRLFGGNHLLNKVPLINGAAGLRFLMSCHRITPAKMADVSGALLHYHLVYILRPEYRAVLMEAIARREYPSNSLERLRSRSLAEKLASSESLLGENSVRFESTSQLVELGLMRTSADFMFTQGQTN